MHAINFIQDLAVIMLVAGVITVLFHRFNQPVVLGYIVAGVIIGPHTPPLKMIQDEHTIQILAELGVMFLLFSLGLEFSLRKLARVGATALVAASIEIAVMIWIGYQIGRFFDWSSMDSIFLGAMLAISSTTIIVKALDELGMKDERFAQIIFGILIVEDILAIGMIALLSAIATTGEVSFATVFATLGKLSLFMIVALVLGILIVPRLLDYAAKFKSNEMLLVTVLGLCFGFCLLVVRMDYSLALGAFVIGAVMAESKQLHTIEHLIEPIRDMFSAIFFVAIGLLLDLRIIAEYALPIAAITVAVVFGKIITCSVGIFLTGNDGRTSMRVGMGLAQIGEFSFIIASLGLTLKVTSGFLYPVAVAVSATTTLLTPYLIKLADPLSARLVRALPNSVARTFEHYTTWLQNMQPQGDRAYLAKLVRRSLLNVLVNFALVATIFLGSAYFADALRTYLPAWIENRHIHNTIIWSGALIVALPFLVAAYRKLKALSMLLAEVSVTSQFAGQYTQPTRHIVAEVIPVLAIVGILLWITALSSTILPPAELLILALIAIAGLTAVLWKRFVKLHSRLQIALLDTIAQVPDEEPK